MSEKAKWGAYGAITFVAWIVFSAAGINLLGAYDPATKALTIFTALCFAPLWPLVILGLPVYWIVA